MTRVRPIWRAAGWLLAGAVAVGLIGAAAAFALAAERRAQIVVLDLAAVPPTAPAVAAVAEAAPDVAAVPPPAPEFTEPEEAAPVVPETTLTPPLASAAPLTLSEAEVPVVADLSLPTLAPEVSPEPTANPKPRPKAKPQPKPDLPRDTPAAEKSAPRDHASPAVSASAPGAAAKPKGGGLSPDSYAKAVLKKVRSTKRKSGAGRGVAVVGFTISADGRLRQVQVLQSSGNADLDEIALDHIRRSAPFPAPPPEAVKRGYSFEFVSK